MRIARRTIVRPRIAGVRPSQPGTRLVRRRSWSTFAVAVLVASSPFAAAACGGSTNSGAPEGTRDSGMSTVATQPSVDDGNSDAPDVTRVMQHINHLAITIGPRPAGSEAERKAAAYLADELASAGYDTTIEEFGFEAQRDNSLVSLDDGYLIALAMQGSPNKEARGEAVFADLGQAADLAGADLRGKVVIFDRGVVTFYEKAQASQAGGAVAALVVNDESRHFLGVLGDQGGIDIPVLAISGQDRDQLLESVGAVIGVRADAGMEMSISQNVIGRRGDQCHAYMGAHYDSVPPSPGANDNASGVAVVLETARVQPINGLCIVFFGAEEVGLFGSRHYVANNLVGMGRFMLNVDMAGRMDGPMIVGDESLTDAILSAVTTDQILPGVFPPFASSDHVSFTAIGVPAVTLTSGEDEALHTPLDTVERIGPEALELFLSVLDASLDALQEQHSRVLTR
ncbi:MAG: M28 family peptidase [Chloroflexi bacterium]|nr:M28 family peptidase [Chloroflexota bacterium]MQC19041.1 hypothetical protein [Chloroflexota bacterium]